MNAKEIKEKAQAWLARYQIAKSPVGNKKGEKWESVGADPEPEETETTETESEESDDGKPEVKKPEPKKPEVKKPEPPKGPNKSKEWQDKYKTFKPAFDKALALARSVNKAWAKDLDSNHAQMFDEAKKGKFEDALKTLDILTNMVKSKEAAQAEVKHKTMQEDPNYKESVEAIKKSREEMTKEQQAAAKKDLKDQGAGMTKDGAFIFALPVKAADWKKDVIDQAALAMTLVKKKPIDFSVLSEAIGKISMRVGQVEVYNSENKKSPYAQAIKDVLTPFGVMQEQHMALSLAMANLKSPEEVAKEIASLHKVVSDYASEFVPSEEEKKKFEASGRARQEARKKKIEDLKQKIAYEDQDGKSKVADLEALLAGETDRKKVVELQDKISRTKQTVVDRRIGFEIEIGKLGRGEGEQNDREAFETARMKQHSQALFAILNDAETYAKASKFGDAAKHLNEVSRYVFKNPGKQSAMDELVNRSDALTSEIKNLEQKATADPGKMLEAVMRLSGAANKFADVLK